MKGEGGGASSVQQASCLAAWLVYHKNISCMLGIQRRRGRAGDDLALRSREIEYLKAQASPKPIDSINSYKNNDKEYFWDLLVGVLSESAQDWEGGLFFQSNFQDSGAPLRLELS